MLFFVWLFEITYIVTNVQAINKSEEAINYLKSLNASNLTTFEDLKSQFLINIIASLALCITLTIAYEKSYKNEERIGNIEDFLKKKFSKSKSQTLSSSSNSNSEKTENIKPESDNNPENIAKKDECPNCFHKIKDNESICPNCGYKLTKRK